MRLTYAARSISLAAVALAAACAGGGSSSSPAPYHPYWAVSVKATNNTANCAIVWFYDRENGGSRWYGPTEPNGTKVKSGETAQTAYTYYPKTQNAQFRVVANVFSAKTCSGSKTPAQADSSTLTSTGTLNASLHGDPGAYAITITE